MGLLSSGWRDLVSHSAYDISDFNGMSLHTSISVVAAENREKRIRAKRLRIVFDPK